MQNNNISIIFFLLLIFFGIYGNSIYAQDDPKKQEALDNFINDSSYRTRSLENLGYISVIVNTNKSPRINEQQLQTNIESQLKKAGVFLISRPKSFLDIPYLVVNVNTVETSRNSFAFDTLIVLNQAIILKRDKSISQSASTWSTRCGLSYTDNISIHVFYKSITDCVDKFINDWREAANPPDLSAAALKPNPSNKQTNPSTKQDDSPFTATYVGGNLPPTIEVFNDSNRTMYFDFGQGKMTAYVIPSGKSQKITLTEGNYKYKASAPRVRSEEGQEIFNTGYVYTWRFYIVTVPR